MMKLGNASSIRPKTYGLKSIGPTRSGSSQGMRLPTKRPTAAHAKHAQAATSEPTKRPRRRSRVRMGRENTRSAVPRSKSRSTDGGDEGDDDEDSDEAQVAEHAHDDVGSVAVETADRAADRKGVCDRRDEAEDREDRRHRPEEGLANLVASSKATICRNIG